MSAGCWQAAHILMGQQSHMNFTSVYKQYSSCKESVYLW